MSGDAPRTPLTHVSSGQDEHGLRQKGGALKRRITAYDRDDEGHWRAILDCGHPQHVRHDPPLVTREWVLTEEGRASRLGQELECKRCDEEETEAS